VSAQFVSSESGEWFDNPDGAGKFRLLRLHDDGGATVEVLMQAGTRGKAHLHPKGEELFMIEGHVSIGGQELGPALLLGRTRLHREAKITPLLRVRL